MHWAGKHSMGWEVVLPTDLRFLTIEPRGTGSSWGPLFPSLLRSETLLKKLSLPVAPSPSQDAHRDWVSTTSKLGLCFLPDQDRCTLPIRALGQVQPDPQVKRMPALGVGTALHRELLAWGQGLGGPWPKHVRLGEVAREPNQGSLQCCSQHGGPHYTVLPSNGGRGDRLPLGQFNHNFFKAAGKP